MTRDDKSTVIPEAETPQPEPSGKNNKNVVAISIGSAVVVIAIALVCFWYFQVKVPHDQAVENYQAAVAHYNAALTTLEGKTTELDNSITSLQAVLDSGEQPLDEALLTSAIAVLGEARGWVVVTPEIEMPALPTKTEAINAATSEINTKIEELAALDDFDEIITELTDVQQVLEASIQQRRQLTAAPEPVDPRLEGLNLSCH